MLRKEELSFFCLSTLLLISLKILNTKSKRSIIIPEFKLFGKTVSENVLKNLSINSFKNWFLVSCWLPVEEIKDLTPENLNFISVAIIVDVAKQKEKNWKNSGFNIGEFKF